MFKRLLLFCCFQEGCTDHRINDTGDECAEADICQKMIRHVNAVIAVDCHKQAGDDKGDRVFLCTPVLSLEEVRRTETKGLVDKFFHGSASAFFSAFLEDESISEEELAALKKIINEKK